MNFFGKAALAAFIFACSHPCMGESQNGVRYGDVIRSVFKLYRVLDQPVVLDSLTEIVGHASKQDFDPLEFQEFIQQTEHPREAADIVRRYLPDNESPLSSDSSKVELRVIFVTESATSLASTFGHVYLLWENPNNLFFSKVVSFVAVNFTDPVTGRPYAGRYFKGAFGRLEGQFQESFFFDIYAEEVLLKGRCLKLYEVSEELVRVEEFGVELTSMMEVTFPYNFFTNNCSTGTLSQLSKYSEPRQPIRSFTRPLAHIDLLVQADVISYLGVYVPPMENVSLFSTEQIKVSNQYPKRIRVSYQDAWGVDTTLLITNSDESLRIYNGLTIELLTLGLIGEEKWFLSLLDLDSFSSLNRSLVPSISVDVDAFPDWLLTSRCSYDFSWDHGRIGIGFQWNSEVDEMNPYMGMRLASGRLSGEVIVTEEEIEGISSLMLTNQLSLQVAYIKNELHSLLAFRF